MAALCFSATLLSLSPGAGTALAQASSAPDSLLHQEAPQFARTDFQGNKLDLHALRGKVVLLDFWATWCASCQVEMPRFVAWQKLYGPRGFQIIGICMDDDPVLARKVVDKHKLNYPVAMGDEKLGQLFGGVLGLPQAYLIDSDGNIQAEFKGETDLDLMERKINLLLRP